MYGLTYAQVNGQLELITNSSNFEVSQSTTQLGHGANLAFDRIKTQSGSYTNVSNKNYSKTNWGNSNPTNECQNNTPWWEINLNDCHQLDAIGIYTPKELSGYYIFTSLLPMFCDDINVLLSDPWVSYMHVTSALLQGEALLLPANNPVKYIRIQSDRFDNAISLSEVELYGRKTNIGCDPGNPNGPGVTGVENCSDGIDNDGDGLIDCEDWPCEVGSYHFNIIQPSCEICNDGEICVVGNGNQTVILNGGSPISIKSNFGEYCYSNLGVGSFDFVLQSSLGCEIMDEVILESPTGNPLSGCTNGDFEQGGSFVGWTGGLGLNNNGVAIINNQTFDDPNSSTSRHSIINTNSFIDPNIPEINGELSSLGMFIAKLGNSENMTEAERLTYCFTVDNDNKDFFFNYAIVLQNPSNNHEPDELPFLGWKIYNSNNPNSILFQQKLNSNDPFLENGPNDTNFKGWTCQNYDLSNLVGQELCIEFNNADCSFEKHWGYSYIDGVCGIGITPNPIINANNSTCFDQILNVEVGGSGYNQFNWEILVKDNNGSITHQFTTNTKIGYSTKIDDLLNYIYTKTNTQVNCDSYITLKFNAYSDCFDKTVEKEIFYSCNSYSLDYCDPIYFCGGNAVESINVIGDVKCDGCTYSWTGSANGLFGTDKKFPRIDRGAFDNAFNNTYFVTVTTPEGCQYEDQITIKSAPISQIEYTSTCDIMILTVTIINVSEEKEISVTNLITNEVFLLSFDSSKSNATKKVFNLEVDPNQDYDFHLDVSNYSEFDEACLQDGSSNCSSVFNLFVPKVPASYPWIVYIPNEFAPSQVDLYLSNGTMIIPDNDPCNYTLDGTISSIYYYKLTIKDRWGGIVFQDHLGEIGNILENGLDISTVVWDGTDGWDYNYEEGVYEMIIEIHSCYSGPDYDEICNIDFASVTNNETVTFVTRDVTLIR